MAHGLSYSGGMCTLSGPGIEPVSPALAGDSYSLCHQEIPSHSLLNGDRYGYKAQGMFPAIFAHEGKESGCSEERINKKLRQKL